MFLETGSTTIFRQGDSVTPELFALELDAWWTNIHAKPITTNQNLNTKPIGADRKTRFDLYQNRSRIMKQVLGCNKGALALDQED